MFVDCGLQSVINAWPELDELSFSEFHKLRRIEVVGLAHEYFRRFDANGNGKLTLDEYDFNVDPARLAPELAFRYRDKDRDSLNSPSVSFTSCVVLKSSGWLTSTSVGLMPMGMAS